MNEDKIIEEANLYLSSDKTIEEVAKELQIGKRTLQLHMKKLETIDLNLYELVRTKQENNQILGRIKGATIGKRSTSLAKEQIELIAKEIISKQLTYKEAEEIYGIPKSTIYEMVHNKIIKKELREQLDIVSFANSHKVTIEQYQQETSNGYRPY